MTDIIHKVEAAPLSMLESLERRGDREAPGVDIPEDIVGYYNHRLNRVDPDGKQALEDSVRIYDE